MFWGCSKRILGESPQNTSRTVPEHPQNNPRTLQNTHPPNPQVSSPGEHIGVSSLGVHIWRAAKKVWGTPRASTYRRPVAPSPSSVFCRSRATVFDRRRNPWPHFRHARWTGLDKVQSAVSPSRRKQKQIKNLISVIRVPIISFEGPQVPLVDHRMESGELPATSLTYLFNGC